MPNCSVCGESVGSDGQLIHSDCSVSELDSDIVILSYPPYKATEQFEQLYRFEYEYYVHEDFE